MHSSCLLQPPACVLQCSVPAASMYCALLCGLLAANICNAGGLLAWAWPNVKAQSSLLQLSCSLHDLQGTLADEPACNMRLHLFMLLQVVPCPVPLSVLVLSHVISMSPATVCQHSASLNIAANLVLFISMAGDTSCTVMQHSWLARLQAWQCSLSLSASPGSLTRELYQA